MKPSVTPVTMFAISERVSPCSARCSARSVGRVTMSSSPSWRTSIARFLRSDRSPRGPATRTTSGSIVTLTPVGTGMGFLPIRDMSSYQICATSSPPTPSLRASWPVITPREVDTIAVPMPPSTLGIDFEST